MCLSFYLFPPGFHKTRGKQRKRWPWELPSTTGNSCHQQHFCDSMVSPNQWLTAGQQAPDSKVLRVHESAGSHSIHSFAYLFCSYSPFPVPDGGLKPVITKIFFLIRSKKQVWTFKVYKASIRKELKSLTKQIYNLVLLLCGQPSA